MNIKLKDGVYAHYLNRQNFKTNNSSISLTIPLKRENATKNSLLVYMLMRGSKKYPNQYLINEALDELYSSTLSTSFDRCGDFLCLKFNLETIDDRYAINNEKITEKAFNILLDVVFNPLMNNNVLCENFLSIEKEHLRKILSQEKDNKDAYAYRRCIEEIFENDGYGIKLYGYEDDIDNISIDDLTNHYRWLISTSRIDIGFSGSLSFEEFQKILVNNVLIKKLEDRKGWNVFSTTFSHFVDKPKEIFESQNVSQGKLVLRILCRI